MKVTITKKVRLTIEVQTANPSTARFLVRQVVAEGSLFLWPSQRLPDHMKMIEVDELETGRAKVIKPKTGKKLLSQI